MAEPTPSGIWNVPAEVRTRAEQSWTGQLSRGTAVVIARSLSPVKRKPLVGFVQPEKLSKKPVKMKPAKTWALTR